MGTTASCDGLTTLGRKMPIATHVMALGQQAIATWYIREAKVASASRKLDQHLSIFPKEKEFDENKISADVRKGNLIIRQLSDLLAK